MLSNGYILRGVRIDLQQAGGHHAKAEGAGKVFVRFRSPDLYILDAGHGGLEIQDMAFKQVFIDIKQNQFVAEALCGYRIGCTGTQGSCCTDNAYFIRHPALR